MLRPMLSIVIIFEMIFALKVFDIIFVLTAGGPADATNVLGWTIYTETFRKLDFGAGSSIAMLLGRDHLGAGNSFLCHPRPWERARMKLRARIRLVVIYVSATIVLAGTVGPFLWLVSSSFQYERQLLNRPPQWLPNPIVT